MLQALIVFKEDSKEWWEAYKAFLQSCGFVQTITDPFLWKLLDDAEEVPYLLVNVDEALIVAKSLGFCQSAGDTLNMASQVHGIGDARYFPGINIKKNISMAP